MLPKRKKSHYPVPGRRESLWKKRGTTIQYLLYFAAGVLLGSIAAVLCGAESIPCRILVNQLRWRERLLFMAILLLYLMIAARCLWGNLMIPVALVLYGIGQGIVVSFLLMLVGLGGIGYILLGILLPRTVQLVALILMCNLAHSRCEQMSGAEGNGQTAMWILSALLLAGGGLLESTVKWKMIAGILS